MMPTGPGGLPNPNDRRTFVSGADAQPPPFTRTVIEGSLNQASAVTPQMFAGNQYVFVNWNDLGPQSK